VRRGVKRLGKSPRKLYRRAEKIAEINMFPESSRNHNKLLCWWV
jgi:hypothetical protein